ncbi:LexA repressor [Methylibium sp. T29]|nr:LexA repressor [Methylibium sp. T29]
MTPRQEQVLAFVRRFKAENQMPPTRMEIAAHFGFRSPNAAEEHLRALAKKGHVFLKPNCARGIYVTGD